jgi:hypothetical protein
MSRPEFIAEGHNGQVKLHDDRVVIAREGILATISHLNAGEAEIPFESLDRLQYKPAVGAQHGYVRFEPAGASEQFNPTDDAHTVTFDADSAPNFERLREEVPEHAGLDENRVIVEDGGATDGDGADGDDAAGEGEDDVDPAIRTLRERFAAGEIDREEYEERLAILQDDADG